MSWAGSENGGGLEAALNRSKPKCDLQAELRWNERGTRVGTVVVTNLLRDRPGWLPPTVIRPVEGFSGGCQKCNHPLREFVAPTVPPFELLFDLVTRGPWEGLSVAREPPFL